MTRPSPETVAGWVIFTVTFALAVWSVCTIAQQAIEGLE